jgi:hypothetical protein
MLEKVHGEFGIWLQIQNLKNCSLFCFSLDELCLERDRDDISRTYNMFLNGQNSAVSFAFSGMDKKPWNRRTMRF